MGHSEAEGTQQQESVAELIARRAARTPDASYLEDARGDRIVDYGALARLTAEVATGIRAAGVGEDGAVLLAVADPVDFALVYLGTLAAGARVAPISPDTSAEGIAVLGGRFSGTVLLVTDATVKGLLAPASTVSTEGTASAGSVLGDRDTTGGGGTSDSDSGPAGTTPGGHGSAVLFTSGSTGTPKGVELDEARLLHVARAVARHNALTPADRGFNPLPLFHINAEVVGLLATLVAGATLVLDSRFHRTGFWALLAARRVTWVNAVPAMLAILASAGDVVPPASVRFIRSASAPLPEPVRDAFRGVPLVVSYGMTEAASQITATPLDGGGPDGTVGRAVGAEVQVRDAEGRSAPAGALGEVWIRGRGVVRRYLSGAAADRFDGDGWLRTGDLGSLDEGGALTLAGRSDDIINRGGELVYPQDVENVLLRDPRVREAVVVARPDDILGQVPVAFVITADDQGTDAAALAAALRARSEHELPRALRPVEITVGAQLPRAATGKVQRARLRASLAQGAL